VFWYGRVQIDQLIFWFYYEVFLKCDWNITYTYDNDIVYFENILQFNNIDKTWNITVKIYSTARFVIQMYEQLFSTLLQHTQSSSLLDV